MTDKEVCDFCLYDIQSSSYSFWTWSRSSPAFFLLIFNYYLSNVTRNRGLHPDFTIHRTKVQSNFIGLIYQEHLVSLNVYLPTLFAKTFQPQHLILQNNSLFIWMLFCWSVNQKITKYSQREVHKRMYFWIGFGQLRLPSFLYQEDRYLGIGAEELCYNPL